jgi:hypothetical protein
MVRYGKSGAGTQHNNFLSQYCRAGFLMADALAFVTLFTNFSG